MCLSKENFDKGLEKIQETYKIYAPVKLQYHSTFSITEANRYHEVSIYDEILIDEKSHFSPKELLSPITEKLICFKNNEVCKVFHENEKQLIFLRSCDLHGIEFLDKVLLKEGGEDETYKRKRENTKFVLIACEESFENCFCVSAGTNRSDSYSIGMWEKGADIYLDIKDDEFVSFFQGKLMDFEMPYVKENLIDVTIPEKLTEDSKSLEHWRVYDEKCGACGRCNYVCITCGCHVFIDKFYDEHGIEGERKRMWTSCMSQGFSECAEEQDYKALNGDRLKRKVYHKMGEEGIVNCQSICVGCGRCDDVCPRRISFSECITKLAKYK